MKTNEKSNLRTYLKFLCVCPLTAVTIVAFAHVGVADKSSERVKEPTEWIAAHDILLEQPDDTLIYEKVEDVPQFPGGLNRLMGYFKRNMNYPAAAALKGLQGMVKVQFMVEKDGSITNAKVVDSLEPSMDSEALRLVLAMPKWEPGKHRGQNVRVKYTVPVLFSLSNPPVRISPDTGVDLQNAVVYIDGKKQNLKGKKLEDVVEPEQIESMSIDTSDKKPVIYVTLKEK